MSTFIGKFATHHWKGIFFIALGLCMAGVYAATSMPSSVFPQTNFPRVVVMIDNGEMPADEMMATITRPIEEAMKDVPGVVNIRSNTGRGSAAISVFFTWKVDMEQSLLHVMSRLAQARSTLPPTVQANAYRLTFSVFPVTGISLTSDQRSLSELWQAAQYTIKPRLLRVPGVARVDLVGGHPPEYHIIGDPLKLTAQGLSLTQVVDALNKNNLVAAAGLHEEKDTLFLTLVDGRLHNIDDIRNMVVGMAEDHPVRIRDFAEVKRAEEPANIIVTADGVQSVLIMVRSQPDGSTLDIVDQLNAQLDELKKLLPPDMQLKSFYDQSILVRDSVKSVRDAIIFGLILSVLILFMFLKDVGSTVVAVVVIPVTVLVTLLAMKITGLSFNLMTLGGIASAIGLVIDDAIVVVEAIHTKMATGMPRLSAVHTALGEILLPLTGSTLTPVAVFIPLAFLNGLPGVFFRALAMTMCVSLLTSLVLAVTLTPSLAGWILRVKAREAGHDMEEGGFVLRRVLGIYEFAVRTALEYRWITTAVCVLLVLAGVDLFGRLQSERLPKMEEHGFVLDYKAKPGTSLTETNRELLEIEKLLKQTPEVESYSRRTGIALGLEITEPNAGDFLVKLRPDAKRSTDKVIIDLADQIKHNQPGVDADLHGMLGDLIGDLENSAKKVEIKIFSTDRNFLEDSAKAIQAQIDEIPGVSESDDGLIVAGPGLNFHVRSADAQRYGLSAGDIATAVETAKLGEVATSLLEGDRTVNIRVLMNPRRIDTIETLSNLPLRTPTGDIIRLKQVADVSIEQGQLELWREDLRQYVAVTSELANRDLGSTMGDIITKLGSDKRFPPGTIEFGGQYKQSLEDQHNLFIVLIMAILLVFTVLLLEFRSFLQPLAIVMGAVLSLLGTVAALYLTNTSLNIISSLGAIIGVGIVAKNGILMLDYVDHLRATGLGLQEALVQSGRRRLRPVLMTSMAAALGMLPLAYGIGSGADMLRPLAIAVIGALCVSVLLSLVATPVLYYVMMGFATKAQPPEDTVPPPDATATQHLPPQLPAEHATLA
jgi:CzcA family heavy metal efflux pump